MILYSKIVVSYIISYNITVLDIMARYNRLGIAWSKHPVLKDKYQVS
jgi:hypothetical protein